MVILKYSLIAAFCATLQLVSISINNIANASPVYPYYYEFRRFMKKYNKIYIG